MNEQIKIAKALKILEKAKAKGDYYSYIKYTHQDYIYNRHGEYIADRINEVIERRERMLRGDETIHAQYVMLSLPP